MVNKIIGAISVKLNRTFGDGYKIYDKSVKQGFKEPCFFIYALNPSETKLTGNRYSLQNPFDIHYFPAKEGDNTDMHDTGSKMFDVLETVAFENGVLIRGTQPHYEIVDGVLHFFIDYNTIINKETFTEAPMDTVTVTNGLKG